MKFSKTNPFGYGTVVSGERFYDRREECARIVATLSGGNNLVLYAPRRFGKTSLVFKAIGELEAMGFVCVYFDFMQVFSPESFVRLFSKALAAKMGNLTRFAEILATAIKTLRPVLGFGDDGKPELSIDFSGGGVDETTVSRLLDLPEKIAGEGKRLLVFFDEFQEMEKLSGINFEGLLRGKVQQSRNVNYLFFGSKTHILKTLFNDRGRAFYNAASQMSIGPLPRAETVAFLMEKFAADGMEVDATVVEEIIKIAGDIPHYIQLLAAETWQRLAGSGGKVTAEIVSEAADVVLGLKSDYYAELFDRQSNSKKELLLALAARGGKNIFSAQYRRVNALPGAPTLQRAVAGLVAGGIIEKNKDGYFIADPFFKRFLVK